jgi:predicted DNA-binding transcriptional regulator AlpA
MRRRSDPARSKGMTKLMTVEDLRELFQLGRTSVYALTNSANFPAPYALDGRIKRWPIEDVTLWLETQRESKQEKEVIVEPTGMMTASGFTIRSL